MPIAARDCAIISQRELIWQKTRLRGFYFDLHRLPARLLYSRAGFHI